MTAKILETLLAYCKAFSANIGHHFTADTIRMSALTGSAGVEIGGDTTARAFGLNCKTVTINQIESFKDTRINIVDEVSFASYKTLETLSAKLQAYTEHPTETYGNIAMVFLGDFCQLPTIAGQNIYCNETSMFWEKALNQMVELEGHHRYADDPELGKAMAAARNGNDADLRKMLTSREIQKNNLIIPQGVGARYATFTNKKRASINANIFREYLQTYHHTEEGTTIPRGALIIRGTGKWGTPSLPLGPEAHKKLWENCSDAHCKNDTQLADPFLSLFFGCELMVTDNIDVKHGIANGTCCQFVKAVLKHGTHIEPIQVHGRWVNSVDISNVDHIELRFDESYAPKFVGTFKLQFRERAFKVDYPLNEALTGKKSEEINIKLTHFPIISNFATTGHKLQGKTMPNLVIAEWVTKPNWAYVVLSRVRTLDGIYLKDALPANCSFNPPPEYLTMIELLRNTRLATPLNDQY